MKKNQINTPPKQPHENKTSSTRHPSNHMKTKTDQHATQATT
jgi:hypothetical protein